VKIYLQRYNFRLEKPSIQGFFTPYLEKTYYICDMQTTLFPDYFALDETCCLHRAEIVMEKLAEIPLDFLATHGERNTVLRRLAEAGVQSLAELLRLQRFDVVEWEGVGRFFLHIFDEMRQEIRNHPEQLIEQWLLQRATWVFPIPYTSDDPWSLHHYVSPSLSPEVSLVDGENQEWTPLIQQVEHTFTHIILLLKHRQPEKAAVLHRFLLQGLSAEVIARVLNLPSRSAVMRPIEHEFLRPLLAGKEVAGIKLSEDFCDSLSALRQQLLFQPTTVLDGLQFMSMPRFLWLISPQCCALRLKCLGHATSLCHEAKCYNRELCCIESSGLCSCIQTTNKFLPSKACATLPPKKLPLLPCSSITRGLSTPHKDIASWQSNSSMISAEWEEFSWSLIAP
jgi:hypothetical protein